MHKGSAAVFTSGYSAARVLWQYTSRALGVIKTGFELALLSRLLAGAYYSDYIIDDWPQEDENPTATGDSRSD